MGVRVIADRITTRCCIGNDLREGSGPSPDDEERRLGAVPLEHIQETWSRLLVWSIVEREGDSLWLIDLSDCRTEQLRSRIANSPGCGSCEQRGSSSHHRPRIHDIGLVAIQRSKQLVRGFTCGSGLSIFDCRLSIHRTISAARQSSNPELNRQSKITKSKTLQRPLSRRPGRT